MIIMLSLWSYGAQLSIVKVWVGLRRAESPQRDREGSLSANRIAKFLLIWLVPTSHPPMEEKKPSSVKKVEPRQPIHTHY